MDRALPTRQRPWLGRWPLFAVLAVAAAAVLWLSIAARGSAALPEGLQWTEVKQGALEDRVSAVGEFISTAQRNLLAADAGSVLAVYRAAGDQVAAGAPILRLGNKQLELELETAESEARRLELEQEQLALDDQEALERAEIAVEDAEFERRTAGSERELNAALYQRQLISRLQFQTIEAKAEQAESRHASAQRLLRLVQSRQRRGGALRAEAIGLARIKRDRLRERVAGLHLTAPVDGWVKSVAAKVGDRVAADTVLATVGPVTPDAVRLLFPQEALGRLKPGVAIEIQLGDQHLTGELLRVAPDPEQGQIVTEARVAALPATARIGMAVRGDALFGRLENAVYARSALLPTSATGGIDIFRDRGNRIERLRLSGVSNVGGALVFPSGLRPGDRVAVDDRIAAH